MDEIVAENNSSASCPGRPTQNTGPCPESTAEMDPPITSSDMMPPSSGPCPESTGPCPDVHTAAVGADEDQSEEEDLENFSDISDNSDLFHVEAEATEVPRTDEDQEMAIVDTIVPHLREHPLLPPDGQKPNHETSYTEVRSGCRLPPLHCGFRGCGWTCEREPQGHWDLERFLCIHLEQAHRRAEMASVPPNAWPRRIPETDAGGNRWQRVRDDAFDALAYYTQAALQREQDHIPIIGPSVDRRQLTLMTKLVRSENVKSYICLCCAQVKTYVRNWTQAYDEVDGSTRTKWSSNRKSSAIQHHLVRDTLWRWIEKHPEAFNDNFNLHHLVERYASNDAANRTP